MKPNFNLEKEVSIMQNYLSELRKIAGWSLNELSQKMGLTRQAVYTLENRQTKMNQLHFLALIYLFKTECENTHNIFLENIINILFNDTDSLVTNLKNKKIALEFNKKIAELASIGKGTLLSDKTKYIILSELSLVSPTSTATTITENINSDTATSTGDLLLSDLSLKIYALGENSDTYNDPNVKEKVPKKKEVIVKKKKIILRSPKAALQEEQG